MILRSEWWEDNIGVSMMSEGKIEIRMVAR